MRRCLEMAKKEVKIELTPEQQQQVRKLTDKEVPQVKVDPEPLDERVSPRLVAN
jgi:hypothetical protein